MAVQIRITQEELGLVHEALAYMRRRIHGPGDAQRVHELADRAEELLLGGRARPVRLMRLSDEHARVLRTALGSYADELRQPFSDLSNRARVARLRQLDRRLQRAGSWIGRLFGWLGGR
ncbi:MAG: hypothetical protein GF330_07150 [Candidatus Eisenbacteria bacterium]|nr:hypothetical protein [Candidatus Eisenbacteria bacterium]